MAKGAKSAGKKGAKGGKSTRKPKRSWKAYIAKVNKAGKSKRAMSNKAVKVMNSFCADMFDQLATQAGAMARSCKRSTITAAGIQAAVRVLFPADLAKHTISEASKAVTTAAKNAKK